MSVSSYITDFGRWTKQIQACLKPALFLAKLVGVDGASCLVHCSDGGDITPIVVSLAKLLLDPYYRTIKGFQVLMEEDWISEGFQFAPKVTHPAAPKFDISSLESGLTSLSLIKSYNDTHLGASAQTHHALVALFLDAVHQIWSSFPQEFEFGLEYLCLIFDHVISCQFGTYLRREI